MADKFLVSMLGTCSISYAGKMLDSNNLRSKKIWELLSYLILCRNKEITQSELVDIVYSEEKSGNPINALKTLIHRVRAALDDLGVDGKNLIIQQNGCYKWNKDYEVVLDTEEFERLIAEIQASEADKDRQLELSREAISIYKGDFLPRFAAEPWVAPINTYLHSSYLKLISYAIELLSEIGSNDEISEICQKAITIDPYEEFLYLQLIQGLINMGQLQNAMNQYDRTTKLFYKEFGVTPSEEMKALYRKIASSSNAVELDISSVKSRLREETDSAGAFYCEYEFFKSVYQLEVRSASRTGEPIHIALISVQPKDALEDLNAKALNSVLEKLIENVRLALRRGDVFARYSVSQLIVMLPNTTMENAEMVLERIVRKFRAAYPRSKGEVTYSFQSIDLVI